MNFAIRVNGTSMAITATLSVPPTILEQTARGLSLRGAAACLSRPFAGRYKTAVSTPLPSNIPPSKSTDRRQESMSMTEIKRLAGRECISGVYPLDGTCVRHVRVKQTAHIRCNWAILGKADNTLSFLRLNSPAIHECPSAACGGALSRVFRVPAILLCQLRTFAE